MTFIKMYDVNGDEITPESVKLYRRLAAHISTDPDIQVVDAAVEAFLLRQEIQNAIQDWYKQSAQFDYTTHTEATKYVAKQLALKYPEHTHMLDEFLDWRRSVV